MIKEKLIKLYTNKTLFNGALFSMFSFINRGISFILLLVLASYIAPNEYGFLNLYQTVGMVLGYFIAMSTQGYSSIVFFNSGKTGISKTFSTTLLISIVMLGLFLLMLTFGNHSIPTTLHLSFGILSIAIFVAFFNIFGIFLLDYYRLKENVWFYGVLSCGSALLNFFVSIYLVKYRGFSWEGRVYAELLCTALLGGFSIYYFIKNGFFTKDINDYVKPMLAWSIPLIPHLATTFIRQGCDRYIISASHTIADVGLFSFALNLANIISMIGFGFNQSNSVDIYKTLSDETMSCERKLQKVKMQKQLFLLLYLVIAVLVFVCCYFFLPIILPKYETSLKYFPLLAIYGLLMCYYLVYTNFLFFYKKTKNLMYITFVSSIVHLLLSLLLTQYSLYFTALLYVVTQLFVVIAVRWQANKLIYVNLC